MLQRMPSLQFILFNTGVFTACAQPDSVASPFAFSEFLIYGSRPFTPDRSTRTTMSTNNDAGAPDDAADHHRDYQPETQTLARCMERARARLASRLMDETK